MKRYKKFSIFIIKLNTKFFSNFNLMKIIQTFRFS